ncbi:unnamed protein product [Protopolystoma xenopodis]|uniref:Transcription initiation factor TFIID subunit 2 TPR repeats domain-containing protein n=1 Tax=Protopolystoma xenopodis TaxID=117903 RepID=A0A3S5B3M6_9PLAT|nr:unnamed protein product [Protopolystoma xenopodis]
MRRLQRFGFLPVEPDLFFHFAKSGRYYDIRSAALECLVDYVRGERDQRALDWIFEEIIENTEEVARLRYETVRILIKVPPFQRGETGSRLDTTRLVERLWAIMNYTASYDARLRCSVSDLYFTLYGNQRPACLPLPEGLLLVRVREGRSLLRLSEQKYDDKNESFINSVPSWSGVSTNDSSDNRVITEDLDEGEESDSVDDLYPECAAMSTHHSDPSDSEFFATANTTSFGNGLTESSVIGQAGDTRHVDSIAEKDPRRRLALDSDNHEEATTYGESKRQKRMERLSDDDEDEEDYSFGCNFKIFH